MISNTSNYPLPVEAILNNNGITAQPLARTLELDEIRNDIYLGRPFVIGWDWTAPDLGGHVVVCRGIEDNGNTNNPMIFLMDPDIGGNNFLVNSFNWVVSTPDKNWIETLRLTQGIIPQADIKVNGSDGPLYTNTSQNLDITASLNPNNYTDDADWWIIGLYEGQFYYRNLAGDWSALQTPVYQGELASLGSYSIYSGPLSPGTYTFFFGIDLIRDGEINDPAYYDSVTIIVQ